MSDQKNVYFSAEFDSHIGTPTSAVGVVRVVGGDGQSTLIEVENGGVSSCVAQAWRDQWGVYLTVGGVDCGPVCVDQEDGTRSFIDALIRSLVVLRHMNEFETAPAKVAVDYPQLAKSVEDAATKPNESAKSPESSAHSEPYAPSESSAHSESTGDSWSVDVSRPGWESARALPDECVHVIPAQNPGTPSRS